MNEPAWILFIVIKYQVKSNNLTNVIKLFEMWMFTTGNRVNIFHYVWGHQILRTLLPGSSPGGSRVIWRETESRPRKKFIELQI